MDASFKLADSSDTDVLAKLMQEYYEFDHLTFDEQVAPCLLTFKSNHKRFGHVEPETL